MAWLTRHAQTSIGSLGRLSQQKLATILTVLVIGIALALPACLHLLISNVQTATGLSSPPNTTSPTMAGRAPDA